MTHASPPPAALSLAPGKGRLGRIARMDRGALGELLLETGALIDAALGARGVVEAERDALATALIRRAWAEAALLPSPAPDERAFVLALALAAVPLPALDDTGLDAALVTRLCARVAAGVASESERALLAGQREADPRIDAAAAEIEAVHTRVVRTSVGAGRATALWPGLEKTLK